MIARRQRPRVSRRVKRVLVVSRIALVFAIGGALVCEMAVTPAAASPILLAAYQAERNLAEVRGASQTQQAKSEAALALTKSEPLVDGDITPGQETVLRDDASGVQATFSGYEIDEKLDVELSALPQRVAKLAATETEQQVLTTPVEITATAPDGTEVTQFPADVTLSEPEEDMPQAVTEMTPGVALEFPLAKDKTEGLDLGSIRIATRETDGEPWVEIPSYYDADAGIVRGELNHLSQFVVIGTKFVPPPGPKIVLDPDDDVGHTTGPNGSMTELPQNIRLAQGVKTLLAQHCRADVTITREDPAQTYVSQDIRAGIASAANADVTMTFAFDAWHGYPWGIESDGGSQIFHRGLPADQHLAGKLFETMPNFTSRRAIHKTSAMFPYPELRGLPGIVAHMETLYIDHNYDRVVIDEGFQATVDGAFTSMASFLEESGFDCHDPAAGGWPSPPTEAEKQRWRNLGFQNYLMYGSDPISFSTGNLIESEPLFSLEGAAGQAIDLTLVYNSQDGRLTRTGAGWSFGLGARAQRFDDGSAMVVRGDGASFMFNPDGAGGFVSEPGVYQTLTAGADGRLTLKSNEGETWVFDTSDIEGIGELVSQTDRAGNTYTLAYGAATDASQFLPLASITDASGQVVLVGSDALGRVSTFRHPDGRVWTLNYNGAGDLVNITNPDGRVRGFTYDDKHQLLTATDAKNVTYLRNEYDAEGRVVKQWDAEGTLRKLAYDPAKGQTTYTDNEGSTTVFHYDSKFRITGTTEASGVTTGYTYDEKNQVTSYSNEAGDVWKYTYDGAGNLTKETKPDGSWLRYTYTPTGEVASVTDQGGPDGADRTTSFEINGRGQVTATHFPDGTIEKRQYDAAGNLTVITSPGGGSIVNEYDGKGNLTKTTDKAGAVTTFVYDAANRVVSQTDAMGGVTTYAYDGGDRVVSQTDPRGGVTSFTYDQNDHLIKQVDPVGAETSYVWDDLFRMVQQIAPDGGVTEYTYTTEDELTKMVDPVGAVTEFELDAQYRAVTTVDPAGGRWERELDKIGNVLKTVDPEGAETATEYDRAGRVTKSVDATGIVSSTEYDVVGRPLKQTTASADGTLESTTSMTYDIMDRVVTVTDPAGRETSMTYDVDGNVLSQTDAAGRVSQNIYDAAGRVTSTVNPVGDSTAIVYDVAGNVMQSTDEAGRVSTFTYDQSGLVLTETDPLGNVVSHEYDVLGREIAVTDANGNRTSTAYTVAGQIASVTDALGGVTTYGYDLAGRQTSQTNARGNETKYVYDVSGQLTEVIEGYLANPLESLGGSGEAPTGDALESAMAKVVSDVNSTTTFEWSSTGQKVKQISPTKAETVFEYDDSGRVLSERNALGKQWTYQYDGLGRLLTESDANGASKKYEYDEAGQVTKVGQVSFEYDAVGQMIAMTDPEGVSGWKYDELGQMTEQIDVLGAKVRYEYDPTGLMTKLTMPKNQVVEYAYDAAGRPLALQSDAGAVAYEWDAAGNLARMVRNSSVSQDNAAASGTNSAAVDETPEQPATGTTGVVTSYAYDALNRPVSITHQTLNEQGLGSANPNLTQKQKVRRLIPSGTEQVTCINASGYLADREAVSSLGRDCVKSWDYLADRTLPSPVSPVAAGDAIVFDYTYDEAGNVSEATRSIGNASVIAALKQAVIAPDDSVEDGAAEGAESEGPADVDPTVLATLPGLTQEQRDQLLASPLAPAVDTRGVSYDRLDRMVGVASSDGVTESFAYDRGGNRTLSRVESPGGIRETKSTFNEVDQLLSQVTSTPAKVELPAASASRSDALTSVPGEGTEKSVTTFEYDSNGNRIKRNVDGEQTSYEYNDDNRLTKVTSLERVSEFGYDGLGREVKQSDTTELGTSETTSTWSGDSVVQQTTKTEASSKAPFQAGPNTKQLTSTGGDSGDVTTLVRDSFGDVALQSKGGEASWSLLDNLGSTAAQAVGGQVTDLASYSAWGVQMFESSGWDAVAGFTGERTDPGYGLNNYFSRTYDPSTGVWLSQDSWRGLLEQPQSLARYGYVMANPMTLIDYMGYSGCPAVSYQTGCPAKKIKPQKPINCARDMKVGMDARQIEINRYCGGLLAEKSVKEVGGWQEETWRWTRVIDRWLSPSVYLIQIASLASFGSGVRSPGSRTSFIPEVHMPRPPLKPRAAPANAVKPDAKIVFGQNPNQISHTFRHVLDGGLSEAAVKQSVLADLSWRAGMFSGQYTGTVIVQGKVLYYSAFQLPGGLINVGRITIGR